MTASSRSTSPPPRPSSALSSLGGGRGAASPSSSSAANAGLPRRLLAQAAALGISSPEIDSSDSGGDGGEQAHGAGESSSNGGLVPKSLSPSQPQPQPPESPFSDKPASSNRRVVRGSDDALFGCIERQQLHVLRRPFGSVLDAGTGVHSLRWLASLTSAATEKTTAEAGAQGEGDPASKNWGMTDYVAVTADASMRRAVEREAEALGISAMGTVVEGNWFDDRNPPLRFPPDSFDTVLVDYLIGAMEGFSPYCQDRLLPLLAAMLKPGGTMHIVGMEPIPDSVPGRKSGSADDGDNDDDDDGASIICRVRQVRDACILLAGHRCYREYPLAWLERHVEASVPSLRIVAAEKFPILYRHETVVKQIDVGRSKLPLVPPELRPGLAETLDALERRSLRACLKRPGGRIPFGFDYVVTAVRTGGEPG